MSVIQGGPGFPFLHPNVYAYIFSGIWSPASPKSDDIPDAGLKRIIQEVKYMYLPVDVVV